MAKKASSRRLLDIAAIAPVFGFILLIPPVIGLFATNDTIFGAPLILVYLFGTWLGIIGISAIIAYRLSRGTGDGSEDK